MPEYAFDIELRAVARVDAENESEARKMLDELAKEEIETDKLPTNPRITAFSIDPEGSQYLFEVDGKNVENDGKN
jgi:hypothetical protein